MKKKNNRKQQTKDIMNAIKAANRKEELAFHGKSIHVSSIVKSKKIYSRKKKHNKKEDPE